MPSASGPRFHAALVADRGDRAACGSAFFRSRAHLAAEGTTHTLELRAAGVTCAVPLVVREIPGTGRYDAVSPYGYPGGTVDGPGTAAAAVTGEDLAPTGLVSVFVRERVGRPCLPDGSVGGRVLLHDPARPRHTNSSFRRALRRGAAAGYTATVLRGTDVDAETTGAFAAAYARAMDRVDAAARYRFGAGYLAGCLRHDGSWLAVTRSADGGFAAGELVVSSDGLLHSYLAATHEQHRAAAPGKLATAALLDLADGLGCPLNHGGGLTPGDGLEASKRGYCNAELPFVVHRIVCDRAAYEALSRGRGAPDGGFFPRYRSTTDDDATRATKETA